MRRQSAGPASAASQQQPEPVRGPYAANSRSRYVELILVVDNKSYENQDKNVKRVYKRCKDIANIVNAVRFYLFIYLVFILYYYESSGESCSCRHLATTVETAHCKVGRFFLLSKK